MSEAKLKFYKEEIFAELVLQFLEGFDFMSDVYMIIWI